MTRTSTGSTRAGTRSRPPQSSSLAAIVDEHTGSAAVPAAPSLLLDVQRAVGNQATARWLRSAIDPNLVVQRIVLEDGPPLAPGNYRYGATIVSIKQGALRATLSDMAGRDGLAAERKWQQAFVADMGAAAKKHSYEDLEAKQSVDVEPTLASRAREAQDQIEQQTTAVQTQFQLSLLNSIRETLANSEKKLQAEGRRYGFPDDESILRPKPVTAGEAAIMPSMPGSADLRKVMAGAKQLADGKQKINKARETIRASGPILGETMRPLVLEPAVREYHGLRQEVCTTIPLLASIERNDERLTELASGAASSGKNSKGPAASIALVKAKEEVRKELAEKLANIAYIRSGMDAQDKINKFWMSRSLRDDTKRSMAIAPASLQNAAVDDKVAALEADEAFEERVKQAMGVALLIASFVPGVAPVAGTVGLVVAAVDLTAAFQQYYWEQAAAGTAMEKAEAISQSEPSLLGLATSIAFGLLEGVAEAKALEGAITVFKALGSAYREARAAGLAAQLAQGPAKAAAISEAAMATEKLSKAAEEAAPGRRLGEKLATDLPADVQSAEKSLDSSLKTMDPRLKEMVLRGRDPVTPLNETLMDLAIEKPGDLVTRYQEWEGLKSKDPNSHLGFEDWLRERFKAPSRGEIHDPAGLVEYGLKEGDARRSFESFLRDDPSREAGVWRDPATGEHVCVQGGPGFVEAGWMELADNLRGGKKPRWDLLLHHHPNRGLAIDRVPSRSDFAHITRHQSEFGEIKPLRSRIAWTDPASGLRFDTEFGFFPGAERPYWTRYRVDDGTFRVASFKHHPSTSIEYTNFIEAFTGKPTDPVPGGNVMPLPRPKPPPIRR